MMQEFHKGKTHPATKDFFIRRHPQYQQFYVTDPANTAPGNKIITNKNNTPVNLAGDYDAFKATVQATDFGTALG